MSQSSEEMCVNPYHYERLSHSNHFHKNKKAMPKIMQNLVVLMEPSKFAYQIPVKGGNMCLNRFCIDEDDAFELSGVHYLKKFEYTNDNSKGKGY